MLSSKKNFVLCYCSKKINNELTNNSLALLISTLITIERLASCSMFARSCKHLMSRVGFVGVNWPLML